MSSGIQVEFTDARRLYQQINADWNKTPRNLEAIGQNLRKLKVMLARLSFMPTQDGAASKIEMILTRDTLELGALWSIEMEDCACFERYMKQLKPYYLDYRNELPSSSYMLMLLGLELMSLLASNRLSEFHSEVERLQRAVLSGPHELERNPYLAHPVKLERYLVEGSYNKILMLESSMPSENYRLFTSILLGTVRNEIASCMEAAYERLRFDDAARLLGFKTEMTNPQWQKNVHDFEEFIRERKWRKSQHNRDIEFAPREKRAAATTSEPDGSREPGSSAAGNRSSQLANYCLATAIELELII